MNDYNGDLFDGAIVWKAKEQLRALKSPEQRTKEKFVERLGEDR